MRDKLIAIVGPTGVGKTKLSIIAAKHFDGEVINGDASQVYRGLDIGTAKITAQEAEGVPHHLIDICDPEEAYTAADFQGDARRAIAEISSRGKLPILVGGTGFYVKAALFDYRFSSVGANPAYRKKMEVFAEQAGREALHERLRAVDPDAAVRIHPHNVVRVIRALEVYHETGRTFSGRQQAVSENALFDAVLIGLTMERDRLYRRINRRVDRMIENGLLDEVRGLYERRALRESRALQAIGYKEFFPYFEGRISLDEAIARLKQNSRRYAKRQFTWFRGQMNSIHWFELDGSVSGYSNVADQVLSFAEKGLKK